MKCKYCGDDFEVKGKGNKFCSRSCNVSNNNKKRVGKQSSKEKISIANTGNLMGSNNPNGNGKYTSDPVIRAKLIEGCKKRGQAGTEQHRKDHSERMKGESNGMRGRTHSEKSKKKMSETVKEQYKSGGRKLVRANISKAEIEIMNSLRENNFEVIPQVRLNGVSYIYDLYIPSKNLIVEYNGDYWHCNPTKYTSTYYNNSSQKFAHEIWDRDRDKRDKAEELGYTILYVGESEYKTDKQLVLNKIKEY